MASAVEASSSVALLSASSTSRRFGVPAAASSSWRPPQLHGGDVRGGRLALELPRVERGLAQLGADGQPLLMQLAEGAAVVPQSGGEVPLGLHVVGLDGAGSDWLRRQRWT